jgi:hypothetical protein
MGLISAFRCKHCFSFGSLSTAAVKARSEIREYFYHRSRKCKYGSFPKSCSFRLTNQDDEQNSNKTSLFLVTYVVIYCLLNDTDRISKYSVE